VKPVLLPCVVALLALPLVAAGQEPPPGHVDAPFFAGQAMRALDEEADLLIQTGKVDDAIEALRHVYEFEVPREHPIYELKAHLIGRLAALYARKGAKDKALDTLKELLADVPPGTPAEAAAWLDAGTTYRALGMTDEALKAFNRAVELSTKLAKTGWRPPLRRGGRPGRGGPFQPPPNRPEGGAPVPTPQAP
jgi:tetratricopeptide (TPR) repeat protein